MNLCFDALDAHVIGGRAGDAALIDGTGQWPFARLLEETAALGGAMRGLGVVPGARVEIGAVTPRTWLVACLAALRLGAVPALEPGSGGPVPALVLGPTAPPADDPVPAVLVEGDDVVVATRDLPLAVALRAGRTDPAPPADVPDGPSYVVGGREVSGSETATALGAALAELVAGRPVDLR